MDNKKKASGIASNDTLIYRIYRYHTEEELPLSLTTYSKITRIRRIAKREQRTTGRMYGEKMQTMCMGQSR